MNMKKGLLAAWALTVILFLSACASAQEGMVQEGAAPENTVQETMAPESTAQARPSAQELTELKNTLEWTEEPSFASFQGVTLDGRAVTQEIFSTHKLTMVNIWATYCNPCIAEMPYLAQLNETYEEGEFQVIGLVVDMLDTDASIHPLGVEAAWMIIDATGAHYTHLLPTDDLIRSKLQYLYGVPETVFVDRYGNVVTPDTQYMGARTYDDWKAITDDLLAQVSRQEADAAAQ